MPEAMFPLTEATLYLATAPKSNSVGRAYSAAMEAVRDTRNDPVPLHLRNAVTGLMRGMGYGRDYRYSHDFAQRRPRALVASATCPRTSPVGSFYAPGDQGFEARTSPHVWPRSARLASRPRPTRGTRDD